MMSLAGWQWDIKVENLPKKYVLVCAPHTSNWDFYYAVFGFWALGMPMKVLIKDTHTKSWYGSIIKAVGGIGINRSQAGNVIDHSVSLIKEFDNIAFLITPEGTRNRVVKWRKGFYYIARQSNVPIVVAIGNYKDKKAEIVEIIDPVNKTYEEVCDVLQEIYKSKYAKYPNQYNERIY